MLNQMDSAAEIREQTQSGAGRWAWPAGMLGFRTLAFFAFGFIFLLVLSLLKIEQPNREVTRWWTYQVIFTNIVCFFLLRWLVSKEGLRFVDLYGFDRRKLKEDLLWIAVLLVPSGLIGYFSVYFASAWFYGDQAPDFMFQSLPLWAAIVSVVVFPLTNALIECTTYFGYSLQRIAALSGNRWLALVLAASFLALQHIGIPLHLDFKYFLWRFVSFLPFAFFAGLVYLKIRRLLPIMVLHFMADLPLAVVTLVMSVR